MTTTDLSAPQLRRASPSAALGAVTAAGLPSTRTTLRHILVLAKRSLIKTWRTPEALIDVTLQPIIFLLMFTYIFGGAIAGGSQQEYLQFLLPGLFGQTIAMASVALGPEPERRHREGRLRPVPLAADRPLGAAGRGGRRRPRPVRDPVHGHDDDRPADGLRRDPGLGADLRRPRPVDRASRCASAGSRSSSA